MAEENTPVEKQEAPEVKQPTELEQRAMGEGWVPQEEWSGDPEQWRPAREFLDRGELFKKIEDQKRELKNVRQAMEDLGRHHAEVKKIAYKEALATLKAQKKDALDAGDHDAVVAIDERIAETREAQKTEDAPKQAPASQEPHPEMVRWVARNAWYNTDRAMKGAADEIARSVVERGIVDPMVILTEVDKQIRKDFPHKFENPNRSKPGAVEGSARPTQRSKEDDVQMNDMEKRIMNRIVGTGAITKEQYLKEFKARQGG